MRWIEIMPGVWAPAGEAKAEANPQTEQTGDWWEYAPTEHNARDLA